MRRDSQNNTTTEAPKGGKKEIIIFGLGIIAILIIGLFLYFNLSKTVNIEGDGYSFKSKNIETEKYPDFEANLTKQHKLDLGIMTSSNPAYQKKGLIEIIDKKTKSCTQINTELFLNENPITLDDIDNSKNFEVKNISYKAVENKNKTSIEFCIDKIDLTL